MKKTIKSTISILTILTLCLGLLAGCGGTDPAVGTWKLTAASMNGESIDLSEVGMVEMQLKADGTAAMTGGGDSAESIWSRDGDTLVIDGMTAQLNGNVITVNVTEGAASMSMTFSRV